MTSHPYTDPANLFTLDLPAEWRLERPEQGPIRMACLAPESVQGFTANVNAGCTSAFRGSGYPALACQ